MDDDPARPGGDTDENNKIKSKGLQFVFSGQRDNFPHNPCPYSEEGNPDMYNKENLAKRQSLKEHPVVQEGIKDFMTEFQTNHKGECSKEEYFKIFMKIGTILKPGIEADDLNRIIKEDFEMDSMDKLVLKPGDMEDTKEAERKQQEFDSQPQKTYDFLTT